MNDISVLAIGVRAVVNCVGLGVFAHGLRPRALSVARVPSWVVRAVLFCVLCVLMVVVRLGHLKFIDDFAAVTCLCTLWLLAVKRITLRNALYVAIVVFLCLDFTVALVNAAYRNLPRFSTPLWGIAMELLYVMVMLSLCRLLSRWAPTSDEDNVPPRSFVMLLMALAPYLLMRSSEAFYDVEGRTGTTMELVLILTIGATFGAFVGNHATAVAAAEKVRRLQLEMDLQEHQRRFRVRKDTIDEVNRRYHDMVRYARACAQGSAPESLDTYLEERVTKDLPAVVLGDTGNDTLDMLLWETAEQCAAVDVRFVPIVDIDNIDTIAGFDIHAMVGNALENAVEAASVAPDREKREVRLRVRQVNRMLFVTVQNHFVGSLLRDGERLLSTKSSHDGAPHGYGVENIRRTAERYGGSISFEVEGDRFDLTIMVPLP